MTPSPELMDELRANRPVAPTALRERVREIAAQEAKPAFAWPKLSLRLPVRRIAMVAAPAMLAVAIATAGVMGVARSNDPTAEVQAGRESAVGELAPPAAKPADEAQALTATDATESQPLQPPPLAGPTSAIGPTANRVQQVSATLTLEVSDSDGVSNAAQEALALTQRLGGHVVSASVTTGEQANASLILRVPVAKVQEAVVGLSALGEIVSQQMRVDDLQESIDAFERRQRSLRNQIAVVVARLDGSLEPETRARLEARLKNLRADLRGARRSESTLRGQGRLATLQLSVVTPEFTGGVAPASRVERTLEEALDVLVWEGVIALAIAIVAAPFALVAFATWLGRRLYRRREEDRLLAT